MVGRDRLQNAVSLNSVLTNASRAIGPAVAGILIATTGVGVCFLANAASFAAVLVRAVDGADLDVTTGETVGIMGPSGCGKSTLPHLLGGLERPSAGTIELPGQPVSDRSERALAHLRGAEIGLVFHGFYLMDELTAIENVDLPALLAGRSPRIAPGASEGTAGTGGSGRPGGVPAFGPLRRPAPAGRNRTDTGQPADARAG